MPTSTFPGTVTGVTVETSTSGALSGDGSSGNKLAVGVDGSTIVVNGSNQLEVGDDVTIGDKLTVGSQETFVYDGTGDANYLSIGADSNSITTSDDINTVIFIGNGIVYDYGDLTADQIFAIGASHEVTFTDSGSTSDIFVFGEHITITDENETQAYGFAINGGGSDLNINGGERWGVWLMGSGGSSLDAITDSLLLGSDLTVSNSGNNSGMFMFGQGLESNESGDLVMVGRNLIAPDVSNVAMFGDGLTATGSNQTVYGGSSRSVLILSSASGTTFDHAIATPGFVGDFTGAQIATPNTPFVGAVGTTGATTYTYKAVAKTAAGHSVATASASVTDGNATLDGNNYNEIFVTTVQGATSYDIYRTVGGATQGIIGNVAQFGGFFAFQDTGLAGGGETAPVTNTTGTIRGIYKANDGTAGLTAGPFTTITAIQVKNGLITTLTGS